LFVVDVQAADRTAESEKDIWRYCLRFGVLCKDHSF